MLFNRVYRIVFPDLNLEFNNVDDEGLKISFEADKDLTHESNKMLLTIWNLSDATRARIEPADTKVEFYAGYGKNSGPVHLFSGTVVKAETKDEGKDVTTKLTLSDGQVALRDSVFSLSFSPGASCRSVLDAAASNMGLPVSYGKSVSFGAYPNGYSYIGKGGEVLTEVCDGNGLDWSIQNNIIQVTLAGGIAESRGLVFGADSGLIGTPERITKSDGKPSRKTKASEASSAEGKAELDEVGWKLTALLSPTLTPGDAIKIESRLVKGWFKVSKLKHSGETHGGDWKTEIEIVEGAKDTSGYEEDEDETEYPDDEDYEEEED